jgi:tetratricopeptide (TPR) repeat protein
LSIKAYTRSAFVLSFISLLLFVVIFSSGCSNSEASKAEHVSRGEAFLKDKKYQEASIEFRNVIQLDDKLAQGHWGLARAYEGMQRFSESFEELRRTVELDANNLDARIKLGNYDLLTRPPQTAEAERLVNEVLQKNPNHIEGIILQGNVLYLQGRQDEALARLNHAIELDPKRVESHLSLAKFFSSSKAMDKAEAAYLRAIELNSSSAIAHTEYGKFLVSLDRLDQAERELKLGAEADSTNRDSLFVLASFYLVNKKLDQAEHAYKALAELDKDKPEGRSILADFYSSIGRNREAVDIYREVAAKTPDYTRAVYRLGELMLQGGDVSGATTQVEQSLKKNPHDFNALLLRARIRIQSGQQKNLQGAIDDLKEVLKQEPASRQALYFMADANFRAGQIDQARQFAGDLQRAHEEYLPGKLIQIQIGLASGDSKSALQTANELIQRLSKATPDSETSPQMLAELRSRALSARASGYLATKDLKAARADFMAARDAAPGAPASYVNLAAVSLLEKKVDEAAGFYDQALALNRTDFDALNGLIENVYVPKGRLDQAHQRVDEALNVQQESAPLHFLKANIYAHQNNAQGAESELRRALAIDANYLPAYSSLGALFAKMKQPDRAIAEYQQVLQRNENAATYTLIGMLEESRSNFDEAARNYRKSLEIDSNSTIAANNLAWLFASHGKGNLDEAVALAQSAVQRFPNAPGFSDTLGWVYQKKGLYGAAAEQFQKALSHDSGNPTYRFHLGMAYAGKGDKTGAKREILEALKRADQLNPADAEEARKTLSTLNG